MKHKHGVEVYLKPVGDDEGDLRFPELEINNDCHTQLKQHGMRCCIPAVKQKFAVVVRFLASFETYTAKDVKIGISLGEGVAGTENNFESWLLPQREAQGQYIYKQARCRVPDPDGAAKGRMEWKGFELSALDGKSH